MVSRVVDADVLVAGGGPVGLVAALTAREHGLSVVVLEPRTGPIDKACGEGLMPSALRRLAALGVDPPGVGFAGIHYVAGSASAIATFPGAAGRGVRRTDLHQALVAAAEGAGVETVARPVTEVRQDGSGVSAGGLRGRWLLAADGLHSAVRRELGLALAPPPGHRRRYGLRRHYRVAPWSDLVEVHWSELGEAYVTPVAADLVGVAVLTDRGMGFDAVLDRCSQLRGRLRGAEPATPVRGAGPLRQRSRAVRDGRVLLVGDAAGYVDALTGEGLAVGFATARAAVAAVAEGHPERYAQAWAGATRSYRWVTTALLTVSGRPRLRPAVVPAAAGWPRLFDRAVAAVS